MDVHRAKKLGKEFAENNKRCTLKKIFLLEDEPVLLQLMEAELKHHDLDVWSFSCPDELKANCELKDLSNQVVITDEHMPGMNGLEFIEELNNELGANRPICIVFTGDSSSIQNKEGINSTDLVVEKPVDPVDFMDLLHNILNPSSS